jgi:hypothetical protein
MATDHETTKDNSLGWPGDLARRREEPVSSVAPYLERLMKYEYLTKVDMKVILRMAGGEPWNTSDPLRPVLHCPFKIYGITGADGPANLILATRNFSYGGGLDGSVRPHGDKGFTVFRKGGDGAVILGQRCAKNPASCTLGLLPGQTAYDNSRTESTDDYLRFN